MFGRINRDPHTRQKLALLIRTAIHDVIDKVRSNATVVEKRIAFGGGAVGGDFLAVLLRVNQKFQELALGFLDLLGKTRIGFELIEARRLFAGTEFGDARADWFGRIFGMARENAKRAAVSWKFLNVEQRQTVRRKNLLHDKERNVGKMFVVNGVELIFLHQTHEMRKFHGDNARWLQ